MATIKASVNIFALLDGNDPGDKRLADLHPQNKDQPKKKPVPAARSDYKLKLMKPPPPQAPAAASKAPRKSPTPAVVAAGLRSAPMASVMNKQSTTPAAPPLARGTNLTSVLFAYPSARERIFKQRQERKEEYEKRQAEAKALTSVSGDDDKGAAKQQPGAATVKKASMPVAKKPAVAPVVLHTPTPSPRPPSIDDINQFQSLK